MVGRLYPVIQQLSGIHRQGAISLLLGLQNGRTDLRIGKESGTDFSEKEYSTQMLKRFLCLMIMKIENIS